MRRTKIVATVGPASSDERIVEELVAAGVDVFRLNFSHGTRERHHQTVRTIRAAAERQGRSVGILQDLAGPKIRTGRLRDGAPIDLRKGDELRIVVGDAVGEPGRVSTTYAELPGAVHRGDRLLLDDGHIELRVEAAGGLEIRTVVVDGGPLGEHKGINAPGVAFPARGMTAKDVEDLAFGAGIGVDFVALSFVQSADDVRQARERLRAAGAPGVPLIAKLERPEAVARLDEILNESDAVMVARGDLGLELPLERVPRVQKEVTRGARALGIPVIVATQMLESMTKDEVPTRAEASDVANAVWDSADAVMLSGETAAGQHPLLVLDMMNRIIVSAESAQLQEGFLQRRNIDAAQKTDRAAGIEAACVLARDLHASAIVGMTHTGQTAQFLSSRRAAAPIFAFCPDERVCRRLALWWGVTPVHQPDSRDLDESIAAMEEYLLSSGAAAVGDAVVVTGPHPFSIGTPMNFVKYQQISERGL